MDMSFNVLKQGFFYSLLLGTTAVFVWMLGSYLYPVLWATIFAIIFMPLHRRIEAWWPTHANLTAFITVSTVCLMVVLPLLLISTLIVQESTSIYQNLRGDGSGSLGDLVLIEQISAVASQFNSFGITASEIETRLETELAKLAESLAGTLISLGQTTIGLVIKVAITVYLMFFFFRDKKRIHSLLLHYIPLGRKDEERLMDRFVATSQAVVRGTLFIAFLQGIIGGLALWIAGVSAPVLWGVVMTILAVIPAVGSALIWFPAGLSLVFAGSIWQGLFVLAVGVFLVSVIDEFLRPILIGRRSQLHDAIVLLATIGGIASFGISGFVIGPIIAALCISLWLMFEEKHRAQLNEK